MISEKAAAENQGPGNLFLIWILLFWEKGESLVSQKKLLLSRSVKTFCMSTWGATTFSASCSWYRTVITAKATLLLPPGNIPENTGERAENCLSVCWERKIILGVRAPWASSLPGSPRGWHSFVRLLDFSNGFMSSIPILIIKPPFPRKIQLSQKNYHELQFSVSPVWVEHLQFFISEAPKMQVFNTDD